MTYLLDTHTFLWFINDDPALSDAAKKTIESAEGALYLSVASVWEMAIKVSLERLAMPTPFGDFIDGQLRVNNFRLLSMTTQHAEVIAALPFHHRDPFDRLIIAQSQVEGFPVIGKDEAFDDYGVQRVW
jgi:PIN domain nuclease of toxin-antitoxin system